MESFLEMDTGDDGNGVLDGLHVGVFLLVVTLESSSLLLGENGLADGSLGGSLAEFSDISTSEVLGEVGHEVEGAVGGNRGLSENGLEDVSSGTLVREGDVDELIETTRSDEGFIKDVGSISSSDEEEVLLGTGTIHLGQELVKHSVSGSAAAGATSSGSSNRVKLIEEEDARRGTSGLVEDITNVSLRLTEPHSEELGSLNGDKVGGALVGNSLGHQGLTATGRAVEKYTLGRLHSEFVELVGMLNGIQDHFSKVGLNILETTDIFPSGVGDFDDSLSETGGVA